jgi:hypothetical protein
VVMARWEGEYNPNAESVRLDATVSAPSLSAMSTERTGS